eukprot:TRINITY_DN5598_c0_g1_i1.p1 TRINITY_DN5598_c0_g1~~TRINITY_DN5598_c0_g1_i1.p1  ORF type:complete len:268 (+),score=17.03 TRINITY_DN5598_c0_g1_i1:123-926(+)
MQRRKMVTLLLLLLLVMAAVQGIPTKRALTVKKLSRRQPDANEGEFWQSLAFPEACPLSQCSEESCGSSCDFAFCTHDACTVDLRTPSEVHLQHVPTPALHLILRDAPVTIHVGNYGLLSLRLDCYNDAVTVDLTQLPDTLTNLEMYDCEFSAPLDLTQLPSGIQELRIDGLEGIPLPGTPDLTQLPQSLKRLQLRGFNGTHTPDLTHLPRNLLQFVLEYNKFTGTPDLTNLPDTLEYLSLQGNEFTGTPDLTSLPTRLMSLKLPDD